MIDIIKANWPAPEHIHALSTTREGGYSEGAYHSLNLATHTGDLLENVQTNRALLRESLDLPSEPLWLNEVHGNKILCADMPHSTLEADGSFAKTPNKVCVITTADCLPVLLTNAEGTMISALHCGWRGLHSLIIQSGIDILSKHKSEIMAWLGPAISAKKYEINDEIYNNFVTQDNSYELAFQQNRPGHWYMDLYQIARIQLKKAGVTKIYGGEYCTYSEPDKFYSYRRESITGRMATLIWMSPVF